MEIKTVCEEGTAPERMHPYDAGADLRACIGEDWDVSPNEVRLVPTGVRCAVPEGYVGLLFARSSVAKRGLMLANGVGVIDPGYTGEIMAPLVNVTRWPSRILDGERIAQLVVVPCMLPAFERVESLDGAERGEGGFGSTGAM